MYSNPFFSAKTELYAVLGYPIKHSLSPLLHNAAFVAHTLDKVYMAFEVMPGQLALAVDMVRNFGIKGINLTMPLKEEIIPYLDQVSPEAQLIGAVNCVAHHEGKLIGYNTDSRGFALSIKAKYGRMPKSALLLGAGGVAKAIGVQLALQGVEHIFISNRTPCKADALADKLAGIGQTKANAILWERECWQDIMPSCDIIINATSVGMGDEEDLGSYIPWKTIAKDCIIYETIYNPLETGFVKCAKGLGLATVSGLDLLLYQAAIAFEIWTGLAMPLDLVKVQLTAFLANTKP